MEESFNKSPWSGTEWESKLQHGYQIGHSFENFDPNSDLQILLRFKKHVGYGGLGEVSLISIDPDLENALRILDGNHITLSGPYHVDVIKMLDETRRKLDNLKTRQTVIELAEAKKQVDAKIKEIEVLQAQLFAGITEILGS